VEEYRCDRPFDTVTCRAFAALPDFVSRCAHLLAPGGVLLAMKGERADQELAALPAHWQRMAQVVPLAVPGLDAARYAVLLRAPD
jgi:16S rRNA (guanine527-N7)-methyltransferase